MALLNVVLKVLPLSKVRLVLPVHKVRRVVLVLPVNPDKTAIVPVTIQRALAVLENIALK